MTRSELSIGAAAEISHEIGEIGVKFRKLMEKFGKIPKPDRSVWELRDCDDRQKSFTTGEVSIGQWISIDIIDLPSGDIGFLSECLTERVGVAWLMMAYGSASQPEVEIGEEFCSGCRYRSILSIFRDIGFLWDRLDEGNQSDRASRKIGRLPLIADLEGWWGRRVHPHFPSQNRTVLFKNFKIPESDGISLARCSDFHE